MGKDLKGKELGKGIGQSKDKRYYARFTDRCGHRSKPYYSFDLKEVKDWLLKQRYEDKLGKTTVFHEKITVKEAYELWYKKKKREVRPQTLEKIRIRYDVYIKEYELYRITDINKEFVEQFMSKLIERELSLTYTNEIKSTFSQILEFSIERGWCVINPFKRYKYPKTVIDKDSRHQQELRMKKFLTTEQQNIFLNYIENSNRCYYKNLFKLLLYTGLRISEAVALKWENVNFKEKCIYVVDNYVYYRDENNKYHSTHNAPTKTQSSNALIPLTNEAYNVLIGIRDRTQKEKQKGLIFLNSKGKAVTSKTIEDILRKKVKTINKRLAPDKQLPNITPHYFRHTFAENFIEQGVHLTGVQYLMRHAHLTTTANFYGHTSYGIAKDAIFKYEHNEA